MPTAFGYLVYFRSIIYLSKKENFPILKAEKMSILYIIFFTFSYNKKNILSNIMKAYVMMINSTYLLFT